MGNGASGQRSRQRQGHDAARHEEHEALAGGGQRALRLEHGARADGGQRLAWCARDSHSDGRPRRGGGLQACLGRKGKERGVRKAGG